MLRHCSNCGLDPSVYNQCAPQMGFKASACVNCTDPNCIDCFVNADICVQCSSNNPYNGLDNGYGVCITCIDPNCLWCTNDIIVCN